MWHWVVLVVRIILIVSGSALALVLAAAAYYELIWPAPKRRRPRR